MKQCLNKRYEIGNKVLDFISNLNTENDKSRRCLRLENAGENLKLSRKIKKMGLETNHASTAPETPHQNGMIEKIFATLGLITIHTAWGWFPTRTF